MDRRKFLTYVGCGCGSILLHSCSTAPITERKQLKIIPEAKLNAQAAQIYEKVKEKEKMSDDLKTLKEIKEIGKRMEDSISEYFYRSNLEDPTVNFDWEYILIDNKKVRNAWCMPGGKIAVYTGILDVTKNINGLAAVMGHEVAHAVAKHSVERASRGMLLNTGARIIDSISDIDKEDLGFCDSVIWERNEASDMVEDIVRIDGCQKPGLVTIEVGGAGELATEEIIRGLHDGLRAVALALEDNEVLPGGGAIFSRIAHAVRESSELEPGRERLAMEAFSRAMETIPGVLVENSGNDALDSILELRTATRNKEDFIGINENGNVSVIDNAWHPRTQITESLDLACETTIGMLRIDQVISSRGD